MLINDGSGTQLRMSICASYGGLPAVAWQSTVGPGEGIAGQVLASGQPLLVRDITLSSYAHLARRGDDPRRSLMLAPIRIGDKIIGLVNASCGRAKGCFDDTDLQLLDALSLFIGKAVQVGQLQKILNSRFAQMALIRDASVAGGGEFQQPAQLARILAKSFYKEMHRAGFDSGQIVQAASEIIAQLNSSLHGPAGTPPGQVSH